MSLIVGITGGIGCGKSYMCHKLRQRGYKVYDCDAEAKRIMQTDESIRQQIEALFGTTESRTIARIVFDNPQMLQRLNAIVHPAVANDLRQWADSQSDPIVFVESAILFESGLDKLCWKTVGIIADFETRIERVLRREGMTREKIIARMNNQMGDEQRRALCDHIIMN